jgi:SAM-dependent methyltransferase
VGTGRGRHALALARRGYAVTGVDLSARAVEVARQRAAREALRATFLVGDMRTPVAHGRFDGAVNLFTSFGFFEDEADHARAVQAMTAALRPGGWLVQDFLNAPFVRATLVPEDERTLGGARIHQARWIRDDAPGGPRVEKRVTVHLGDGPPHVHTESVRLLTCADFAAFYDASGLDLLGTYGDDTGRPYTADAPRLVLHARRREV